MNVFNLKNKTMFKASLNAVVNIKDTLKSFCTSNYYSHIDKPKNRLNLIQISAVVMGIAFCFAAETAFVSPILLNFGLNHTYMTLAWCISPILGFFITPLLGVISDNCRLKIGRRRPFIFFLSIGVVLGLILLPNGRDFGKALGDTEITRKVDWNITERERDNEFLNLTIKNSAKKKYTRQWGLFLTILGTALLDFDATACLSPARAYLLDVTLPEDHARGLSTVTIMAGIGGALGYTLSAIHWHATMTNSMLENHIKTVFMIVLIIFIICLVTTLCSYSEIPLSDVNDNKSSVTHGGNYLTIKSETIDDFNRSTKKTKRMKSSISAPMGLDGGEDKNGLSINETSFTITDHTKAAIENDTVASRSHPIHQYFYSIIFMPSRLRIVCLTDLFCWMSFLCYYIYFTDFVGEAIFNGNPHASINSLSLYNYENGVQFACWGMAVYSLSCSIHSNYIDKLITTFGIKFVYIGGQLTYCFGMTMLAVFQYPTLAIIFSCTAGIMFSTMFNVPYILISHYHTNNLLISGKAPANYPNRGLGTDIAIMSTMMFLAELIVSACMGSLVNLFDSTVVIVCSAALLSCCSALSATQIFYSNL